MLLQDLIAYYHKKKGLITGHFIQVYQKHAHSLGDLLIQFQALLKISL